MACGPPPVFEVLVRGVVDLEPGSRGFAGGIRPGFWLGMCPRIGSGLECEALVKV